MHIINQMVSVLLIIKIFVANPAIPHFDSGSCHGFSVEESLKIGVQDPTLSSVYYSSYRVLKLMPDPTLN